MSLGIHYLATAEKKKKGIEKREDDKTTVHVHMHILRVCTLRLLVHMHAYISNNPEFLYSEPA